MKRSLLLLLALGIATTYTAPSFAEEDDDELSTEQERKERTTPPSKEFLNVAESAARVFSLEVERNHLMSLLETEKAVAAQQLSDANKRLLETAVKAMHRIDEIFMGFKIIARVAQSGAPIGTLKRLVGSNKNQWIGMQRIMIAQAQKLLATPVSRALDIKNISDLKEHVRHTLETFIATYAQAISTLEKMESELVIK